MESIVEKDVCFIERELLPEMVQNRCFCEVGSREFVELVSVKAEPLKTYLHHLDFAFYRATVVIEFSCEPQTFYILIKLLAEDSFSSRADDSTLALAYDGFLNEEIFWNKATLQYGKELFPKFYVADMGRYGRPVIVVEDLEKLGFQRILHREFNRQEARAVIELIGAFHGKGMLLKKSKFSVFREFSAKFQDITFAQQAELDTRKRLSGFLDKLKCTVATDGNEVKDLEKLFGADAYTKCKDILLKEDCEGISTICQGLLLRENLWFKKNLIGIGELEVRILDWQRVRYGSHSLDLVQILSQCKIQDWDSLIEAYISAVEKEYAAVSGEQLREGFSSSALFYALLTLSLGNNPALAELSSILSLPFFK